MSDRILNSIEATVNDIQAITNALVAQSSPAADTNPIDTDAKEIESQMRPMGHGTNGTPRYILHYLAFHDDYATAKQIANSMGWSEGRAHHFVGQSYSTEAEACYIAKARARLAGGAA